MEAKRVYQARMSRQLARLTDTMTAQRLRREHEWIDFIHRVMAACDEQGIFQPDRDLINAMEDELFYGITLNAELVRLAELEEQTEASGIDALRQAIQRLPSDPPCRVPGIWYETQKQHWLGWLDNYHSPGGYGRIVRPRNAKWVYNHVVDPYMLFWLVETSGVHRDLVESARRALSTEGTFSKRSGAIRKVVSWADVARALWSNGRAANG